MIGFEKRNFVAYKTRRVGEHIERGITNVQDGFNRAFYRAREWVGLIGGVGFLTLTYPIVSDVVSENVFGEGSSRSVRNQAIMEAVFADGKQPSDYIDFLRARYSAGLNKCLPLEEMTNGREPRLGIVRNNAECLSRLTGVDEAALREVRL
jgi:hypothetical protein